MVSLSRLFGRSERSSEVAKDRLRRVVAQDRTNVSPAVMEGVRAEMVRVLSGYMEVDEQNSQITIDSSGRSVNLVATVPIRRVKRESEAAEPAPPSPPPAPAAPARRAKPRRK
ncbi:MAG: cell division topological specificity factor MinE [Armatimonadetes bacterium]|nr:cell division topological specificity factor MinE [Armatimonadota bacterium]